MSINTKLIIGVTWWLVLLVGYCMVVLAFA